VLGAYLEALADVLQPPLVIRDAAAVQQGVNRADHSVLLRHCHAEGLVNTGLLTAAGLGTN
jgi:hypothetical protein